jgi:homopolymeric O-antigen transport system ATP-binding protein
MKPAILVENLSKQYNITLGKTRHDTLRDQLSDLCKSLFRRNGSSVRHESFWALQDISFKVMPGEVIGVVGRNGAGKSTLLKILSRITAPTTGVVEIHGRIGSLLEVGTGFHTELTGRENVYLNGAILGMRKAEIERKFDEIVAFAEVERFIDTPVKRYSSGMYIRLAFAVAAHLEPEVLIVDEVLAVGDTAFQNKCLGKMQGVAREGRTVLFVSHNMAAVQHLCSKVMVLVDGKIAFAGATKEGTEHYFQTVAGDGISQNPAKVDLRRHSSRPRNYKPILQSVEFFHGNGKPLRDGVKIGGPLRVAVRIYLERPIPNLEACIGFETLTGQRVFTAHTAFERTHPYTDCAGEWTYVCEIPSLTLVAGVYKILVAVGSLMAIEDLVEDAARIEVLDSDYYGTGKSPWNGLIVLKHHWHLLNETCQSHALQ